MSKPGELPGWLSFQQRHFSGVCRAAMFWRRGQRCRLWPYGCALFDFRGRASRLQQLCRSKHTFGLCKLRYCSCQWRDSSLTGTRSGSKEAGSRALCWHARCLHVAQCPFPCPLRSLPNGGCWACCWRRGVYPTAGGVPRTVYSCLLFL